MPAPEGFGNGPCVRLRGSGGLKTAQMNAMTNVVFCLWPLMMGAGWLAFWRQGLSPQWRNFLWPIWMASGAILMSLLLWQQDGSALMRLAMIGGLWIYAASVSWRVRFCPNCASMETGAGLFERPRTCTACGKPMDAPAPTPAPGGPDSPSH